MHVPLTRKSVPVKRNKQLRHNVGSLESIIEDEKTPKLQFVSSI